VITPLVSITMTRHLAERLVTQFGGADNKSAGEERVNVHQRSPPLGRSPPSTKQSWMQEGIQETWSRQSGR